jgi:asparagine N-glycosylation enzyme membrane subunit Stt3
MTSKMPVRESGVATTPVIDTDPSMPSKSSSERNLAANCHVQVCVTDVNRKGSRMLGTVLLVVLILMLIGALPSWPHSRNWGYYPSGGLGLLALILLILLLLGYV